MGRCLSRFLELEGVERALALSSRAFVALIPLGVVLTALAPAGESFGDRLVRRFALKGEAADAVRRLFAASYGYQGAATVIGLAALLVTCVSFARTLERTYERVWRLKPLGARGMLRGLVWIGGFAAFVAFVVPARNALRDLGGTPLYVLVTIVTGTVLWAWTPYILLGRRIHWRGLVPSAIVAAIGLDALTAASALYLPRTIERSAEVDGVIGVSFALLTWLFAAALVIMAAAVIGAEASRLRPALRGRES